MKFLRFVGTASVLEPLMTWRQCRTFNVRHRLCGSTYWRPLRDISGGDRPTTGSTRGAGVRQACRVLEECGMAMNSVDEMVLVWLTSAPPDLTCTTFADLSRSFTNDLSILSRYFSASRSSHISQSGDGDNWISTSGSPIRASGCPGCVDLDTLRKFKLAVMGL